VSVPNASQTPDRPGLAEQLSYIGGEFASNFAWNMVAGFLLYYYSDIALLPVAALGTLMLAARVLDAAIDPIVGIAVDHTRSRWGQARPYLLFASIPFGILCVATFAVPDWAPSAKVLYGYLTFTLLGVCYSLLYIPYGALQPMMVRDPALKVRIGSWRAMATSLASIVVYSLVQPIASLTGPAKRAQGFTLAATVVATISVALYLLVYARVRERFVAPTKGSGQSVIGELRRLAANPVWQFVFIYVLLIFIRIGVMVSVTAYFANNVLHRPWVLSVLLPMLSVAILLGGFLAGQLLRRFGRRTLNALALVSTAVIYLVLPYFEGSTMQLVAGFMAANIGGGILAATVFIACSDAVEYHEWTYGERSEGLVFATVSFGMKVGMAIGAAATAYALSWVNYDPRAMSSDATQMVRILFYYVPVGLCVLQLVCVWLLGRERVRPGAPATGQALA
jgi:GPH family glycoside/pentoside/hexuronide:cation symporter